MTFPQGDELSWQMACRAGGDADILRFGRPALPTDLTRAPTLAITRRALRRPRLLQRTEPGALPGVRRAVVRRALVDRQTPRLARPHPARRGERSTAQARAVP